MTQITAIALLIGSILLTVGMLWSRRMMFGFPAGILWAITGGFAYQITAATWDMWYILFFASMGMAIFSFIAMYALRKRDLAGPDADKGQFIDEGSRQLSTRGYRYDGSGHRVQYADDEGEYGEPDWGDIDRLPMDATSDPAWDAKRARQRRDKADDIRDRIHANAEERRKRIGYGEFE